MSENEALKVLKEIKNKLDALEIQLKPVKPAKENNSDLYDPDGVLWKNRAMEYKRKLDKLQKTAKN